MMAPDLIVVLARVQEEIGAQLDVLDREGGVYAARVLQTSNEPRRVCGPKTPAGMSPVIGKLIRDLVMDELAAISPHRLPVQVHGRRA
jgi:hypothetical protein